MAAESKKAQDKADAKQQFNPKSREIKLSCLDLSETKGADQSSPAAVLFPVSLLNTLCIVRQPIVRRMEKGPTSEQRYRVIANADCVRLARQILGSTTTTDLKLRCIQVDDTWSDTEWQLLEAQAAPYLFGELSTRDQMEARKLLGESRLGALLKKPTVRQGLAPVLQGTAKRPRKVGKKDSDSTSDG